MNFGQAIASGFSNYVGFSGRAARSEFWYWMLFNFLLSIGAGIVDVAMFPDIDLSTDLSPVRSLVSLAMFPPSLAVIFRRLHDIDRTGWWFLIVFTVIGLIVLIYWHCLRGTNGPNRFGPDPLGGH